MPLMLDLCPAISGLVWDAVCHESLTKRGEEVQQAIKPSRSIWEDCMADATSESFDVANLLLKCMIILDMCKALLFMSCADNRGVPTSYLSPSRPPS